MFSLDFEDFYITEDDFCNGHHKWVEVCISFDSPEVFYYFILKEGNTVATTEEEQQ